MNLRNPKLIRLCGWGALVITLLVIGAGAFLATTFFQSGDVLYGGIGAGITVATALFGGLLSYGCLAFAGLGAESTAPAAAEAAAEPDDAASETLLIAESTHSGESSDVAVVSSARLANVAALPPELSDDAIPVFVQPPSESSESGTFDFEEDLLVVPPPAQVLDDSDSLAAPSLEMTEEFDSRMDLPVTIDPLEPDAIEQSDAVEPAPIPNTQTAAVASALTQTHEVDAIAAPPAAAAPASSAISAPSPTDAFPEIFKSTPSRSAPTPPAPLVAPAARASQPASPVQRVPEAKKTVEAKAPVEILPATFAPHVDVPAPEAVDLLPTAAELPDMATTLTPTAPAGGALPTEIPDFFLRMPTGRPMPSMKSGPPVAPIAPRQVAATIAAAPIHPPAAVRIVDSTTVEQMEDDLVTMTAIPDDWPS